MQHSLSDHGTATEAGVVTPSAVAVEGSPYGTLGKSVGESGEPGGHDAGLDHAKAVIVGRTRAPGHSDPSQHDAALDALGDLGLPLIADIECGHVPPHLQIVNGALASSS